MSNEEHERLAKPSGGPVTRDYDEKIAKRKGMLCRVAMDQIESL